MSPDIVELLMFIVTHNFITIIVSLVMFVLMKRNSVVKKDVLAYIISAIIVLLVLSIADGVDVYLGNLGEDADYPKIIRLAASVTGYILLPVIALLIWLVVLPKKHRGWYLWIPAVVNVLIYLTAFFPWGVFSITDSNHWSEGGPIGFLYYSIYVVAFFYLFGVCVSCWVNFRDRKKDEALSVIITALFILASGVLASVFNLTGLVNNAISVGILFFYLFLTLKGLSRDSLTNLLNRASYYNDLKYNRKITAIISIDMNNLKVINDTYGHTIGDLALEKLASIISESLPKFAIAYRIGGDEFVIICNPAKEEEIQKIVDNISERVRATDYTIAIGYAYVGANEGVDELVARADEAMYLNKKECKQNKVESV